MAAHTSCMGKLDLHLQIVVRQLAARCMHVWHVMHCSRDSKHVMSIAFEDKKTDSRLARSEVNLPFRVQGEAGTLTRPFSTSSMARLTKRHWMAAL